MESFPLLGERARVRGCKTLSNYEMKTKKEFRRELRKNMTNAERILWKAIRNRKLEDRKFRRQHSIAKYTVDFFCFEENLVIELDGKSHDNVGSAQYDFNRDEEMKKMGYRVVRFKNEEVYYQLEGVLNEIKNLFYPSPQPSPRGEGRLR